MTLKSAPVSLVIYSSRFRPATLLALTGLSLIVTGFWLIRPETPAPGVMFLLPTVGTALVILYAGPGNAAGRLLSLRPLTWLGLVSFGTYLWHQPLLVLTQYGWFGPLPFLVKLGLVTASVALGAASYFLVEQPVRQKRLLTGRTALLAACACALALPAASGVTGYLRWLIPASGPEAAYLDGLHPGIEFSTAIGLETTTIPFALFGDSHAGHYRKAMTKRFGPGVLLTYPSCLAAPGVSNKQSDEADYGECRVMPQQLVMLVRKHKVRTVIWGQIWDRALFAEGSAKPLPVDDGAQLLEEGMQRLADHLPGTRFIIMGNVPTAAVAAPQMIGGLTRCRAYLNVTCPISYPARKARGIAINARLRALAARDPRFVYVDTAAPLCPQGRCRIVQDGTLNYWDANHLTQSGAWRVVASMPDLR